MQGYKKTQSRKEIMEALNRNKRMGVHRNKKAPVEEKANNVSFLEWYVFDNMGITPQNFIGSLQNQYSSEENFRDRRQRNIEFVRGRHFNEPVYDAEIQRTVTQWQYLKRRNMPPLTYNVISKLVRSLTGQFREINTGNIVVCDSKDDKGADMANQLSKCLNRIKTRNKGKSKDANNYKEMLLSGSPVFKIMWADKDNTKNADIKYRVVNRSMFMVNPGIVDYDKDNLHTETEIHDTSMNDIIEEFSNGDYEKGMQIKHSYISHQGNSVTQAAYSSQSFDGSQLRNQNLFSPGSGNSSYRYFETWKAISDFEAITYDPLDGLGTKTTHKWRAPLEVKKEIEEENEKRKGFAEGISEDEDIYITFKTDFVRRWYVIFMTPWGQVLDVRESPYKSGLPPYVFPAPDINGEVWGIVEEVLSAQLSLDRQILQADAIVANASKGMWLVPDTAIPDTHTQKQYLSELKKVDGAVVYKVRDGAEEYIPKQVYANSSNVSGEVQQLISLYSGLVDEISGNYGAAQGQSGGSGKTATGYALESQNASLNIRDIVENYLTMLVERDDYILKLMLEGYSKSDFKRITGIDISPMDLKMFQFSIEQSKGTNSPAHRLALEQELLQLVRDELMPFEVFLEVSSNPVMIQAKQKLDEMKKSQAQEAQAQAQQKTNAQSPPPSMNEDPIQQQIAPIPQQR